LALNNVIYAAVKAGPRVRAYITAVYA